MRAAGPPLEEVRAILLERARGGLPPVGLLPRDEVASVIAGLESTELAVGGRVFGTGPASRGARRVARAYEWYPAARYLRKPRDARRPAVVVRTGGIDGYKEDHEPPA